MGGYMKWYKKWHLEGWQQMQKENAGEKVPEDSALGRGG